jgi:hypothetical protein
MVRLDDANFGIGTLGQIVMAITKSLIWAQSVSKFTVARSGAERVSPRQRSDDPFAGAMETTMNKSNDIEPTRELTADELEHVSGGKGDPKGQDYLVVTLKDVIVTSVSPGS